MIAVRCDNARAFLTPVLKRVKSQVREVSSLSMIVDSKKPAFFLDFNHAF
jgi:hypothetical protein